MKTSNIPKPLVELVANDFKNVPKRPGVYIIFWIRDRKPRPIHRILGTDKKGILYIGATRSKKGLRGRLRDLRVSVQMVRGQRKRKRYPHTFGPSLAYTGLSNIIKDNELGVYFKEFSKEDAENQEKSALFEYTRKYGEPPPLNLQVGRQYFGIYGLSIYGESRYADELDDDLRSVLGL